MRLLLLALATFALAGHQDPPYSGTVWIDPDVITPDDPTAYAGHTYSGRGMRTIYDRRPAAWIQVNAYLFEVSFDDGTTAEFIINPEFGSAEAAEVHVARYAPPIGQLSTSMRRDMREVWINGGDEAAGGGNNSILLHTGYGERHLADGFLEEVLVHEAGHTSFDADYAQSAGWIAAQNADGEFISTYARDNPVREDISESLLPYFAVRYRRDRISQADYDKITQAIPNRIAFLDGLTLDWYPMVAGTGTGVVEMPERLVLKTTGYPNPFTDRTTIRFDLEATTRVSATVFDVAGRRVATLLNEPMAAGPQEVSWNGTDEGGEGLAAGQYLVMIEAGERLGTHSVTLVR